MKTPSRGSDQCEGNARTLCPSGEIGIRAVFRRPCLRACGFESHDGHLDCYDDLYGRYANGKRSALNPDAGKTVTSSSLVPSAGKGTIGTNSKTVVHLLNNTLSLKGRYSKITG